MMAKMTVLGALSRLAMPVVLVLGGCSIPASPVERPTPPPMGETFKEAPKDAPPGKDGPGDQVPRPISQWWRSFGSPELDSLVEKALASNHDLKAAVSRIAQAHAQAIAVGAAEWPAITAFASGTQQAPGGGIGSVTLDTPQQTKPKPLYEVGLRASYELDLWGKNDAATDAAIEVARGSLFDRESVALTLVADVVATYFQILTFEDRIRVAKRNIDLSQTLLRAVQDKRQAGDATEVDVLQQKSSSDSFDAVLPVIQLEREQALHHMALLLGLPPSALRVEGATLVGLDVPQPQPGLPSDLLRRRPDIRKAESNLRAANANIYVAQATLLPTFALTGDIGRGSVYLSRLHDPASAFWDLAINIVATVWDAGKGEATVVANQARYQELLETYRQAILASLRDVEDALAAARLLSTQEAAQERLVGHAREAYGLSEQLYKAGLIDYLVLLDTQRTLYRNEDELITVRLGRLRAVVDLYKALGGGWEPPT